MKLKVFFFLILVSLGAGAHFFKGSSRSPLVENHAGSVLVWKNGSLNENFTKDFTKAKLARELSALWGPQHTALAILFVKATPQERIEILQMMPGLTGVYYNLVPPTPGISLNERDLEDEVKKTLPWGSSYKKIAVNYRGVILAQDPVHGAVVGEIHSNPNSPPFGNNLAPQHYGYIPEDIFNRSGLTVGSVVVFERCKDFSNKDPEEAYRKDVGLYQLISSVREVDGKYMPTQHKNGHFVTNFKTIPAVR